MNKTRLIGNWYELKGKIKKGYAELTDNDLLFDEGREDEKNGKLQKKLGKSREDVERLIRDL